MSLFGRDSRMPRVLPAFDPNQYLRFANAI